MNRIGIIGAMDEEVDMLKKEMKIEEIKTIANMKFYIGRLENKNIILVRCGIGKVNAALCTQVLISEFKIEAIINTGVAGAITEELDVLDVVISRDVQQHDFDVTGFGYKLGEIPRMERSIFNAESLLVDIAFSSANDVLKGRRVIKGRIVSGDVFVNSSELKNKLGEIFEAHCAEMEGAAIGHVCYVNHIPFVIIRAMSDKADGSAHDNFNEFVVQAANYSKDIVKNMLRQM